MASVEVLKDLVEGAADAFQPYYILSEEVDALTIYLKPDADYSKRLCDHVTLLLSLETNEIVGCRIKGIRGILDDLPNYIRANHDGVQLSVVFLPFRGRVENEESRRELNELARRVGEEGMLVPT